MIKITVQVSTFLEREWQGLFNDKGEVHVYTGSSPHGQGHETGFAELDSEELGVPFEKGASSMG